jgi:hypothetical protein
MVFASDKSFADDVINQFSVSPVGKRVTWWDSGTMALRWLRDNSYAITQVEEQERGRFRSTLKPLLSNLGSVAGRGIFAICRFRSDCSEQSSVLVALGEGRFRPGG